MASITQFEYLLAVDRFRHFKKAADSCHVSQPTLSAQLQKLEEELDLILFDRSKKPIVPTDQGKLVIEQARAVIRQYQKLLEIAQNKKNQVSGSFHLGVIPTLAPYLIPLFLENFSKSFPEVSLTIEEYKTEDIIQLLHQDRLDGALLVTPLKEPQLIEKSLFFEPFTAFVSEQSALNAHEFVNETELTQENVWLLSEGHCLRDQTLKVCHANTPRQHPLPNVQFTSGNLETLKKLVKKQGGYTLLPYLATLDLSSEDLKLLRNFSEPIPTREVSLVYSRTFLKENIINALEEVILQSLPQGVNSYKNQKIEVVPVV